MERIQRTGIGSGRRRRGAALVAVVIVLVACMGLGVMLFETARSRERELVGRIDDRCAEALAEAALAEAVTAVGAGFSGNVGTIDAPARIGDGIFWVESQPLAGGSKQLVATALQGSGRSSLAAVVEPPGEEPLFQYMLQSDEEMTLASSVSIDSYNSKDGTYASQVGSTLGGFPYAGTKGDVSSNEGIVLNALAHVFGDATPGPGYAVALNMGSYVDGSTAAAPQKMTFPPIEYPGLPAAGTFSVAPGGTKSLGPGNFGYTGLSIGKAGKLKVTGPATIEVSSFTGGKDADLIIDATNGPVSFYVSGNYTHIAGFEADAVAGSPMALAFFIGGDAPIVFPNAVKVKGGYYAPEADITFCNDNEAFGSFAANKITMANTMKFHYDEALSEYWGSDGDEKEAVAVHARFVARVEPDFLLSDRRDPFLLLGLDKAALPSPADAWWNP